jgi:hypothetical protein
MGQGGISKNGRTAVRPEPVVSPYATRDLNSRGVETQRGKHAADGAVPTNMAFLVRGGLVREEPPQPFCQYTVR